MKIVYTGLESSGKSLHMAYVMRGIVMRNKRWFKKTGVPRPIVTNLPLSVSFQAWITKQGIPVFFFTDLNQLVGYSECDVFIDELSKYFDSRSWTELSLDAKHWISQGAKSGVHVFASSQNFAQVDVSYRRLVKKVFIVKKIVGSRRPMMTSPAVKLIWGLYYLRGVKADTFRAEDMQMKSMGFPRFGMITKNKTDLYNTSGLIKQSELPLLEHIERKCLTCNKVKIIHR